MMRPFAQESVREVFGGWFDQLLPMLGLSRHKLWTSKSSAAERETTQNGPKNSWRSGYVAIANVIYSECIRVKMKAIIAVYKGAGRR